MLATLSMLEGDKEKGVEVRRAQDRRTRPRIARRPADADGREAGRRAGFEASSPRRAPERNRRLLAKLLAALNDFRKGRIRAALEQASRIHEQHPDRVNPLDLIAACHSSGGEWEPARAALLKAFSLQPNEPSAARNLAQLELNEGNTARATELLEELLKARPEQEQAALMLAAIVTQAGDAKKSMDNPRGSRQEQPGCARR